MDKVKVTMRHIRAAHLCSGGARVWFERHKLDWMDFLKNGIPVEQIEAIDDAMALKVVEVARGRS